MPCPHCAVTATAAQPERTSLGERIFRCSCGRRICNERTGTPFKHVHAPTDVVLLVVPWRVRDKRSLRDLAELFLERGCACTHETVRDREARCAPPVGRAVAHQTARHRRHHVACGWDV